MRFEKVEALKLYLICPYSHFLCLSINGLSAIQVCTGFQNTGTSERSEKQMPGKEGITEEPSPISVGEETVKESKQDEEKGEQSMIEATKPGPEEQRSGSASEVHQTRKTNEESETAHVIVNEETVRVRVREAKIFISTLFSATFWLFTCNLFMLSRSCRELREIVKLRPVKN